MKEGGWIGFALGGLTVVDALDGRDMLQWQEFMTVIVLQYPLTSNLLLKLICFIQGEICIQRIVTRNSVSRYHPIQGSWCLFTLGEVSP